MTIVNLALAAGGYLASRACRPLLRRLIITLAKFYLDVTGAIR